MSEVNAKFSCSFFGHRNVCLNKNQYQELERIIEKLIVNYGIKFFLFGSRSTFDEACCEIVSKLKNKYPEIIRRKYTCVSESCILEKDKKYWEDIYFKLGIENDFLVYDEEVSFKDKLKAGVHSYIKRNFTMIDDSEVCVFYYDKLYKPKSDSCENQRNKSTNSGTKIAYDYAIKKNKIIINVK